MEALKARRVVRDSAIFNQPAGMLKNRYVRVASLENAVRSYPGVPELRVTRTVAANCRAIRVDLHRGGRVFHEHRDTLEALNYRKMLSC